MIKKCIFCNSSTLIDKEIPYKNLANAFECGKCFTKFYYNNSGELIRYSYYFIENNISYLLMHLYNKENLVLPNNLLIYNDLKVIFSINTDEFIDKDKAKKYIKFLMFK